MDKFRNVKTENHGRLVDLSHEIEEDMPVFKGIEPPKIYPSLTHEKSRPRYSGLAEFELTKVEMTTLNRLLNPLVLFLIMFGLGFRVLISTELGGQRLPVNSTQSSAQTLPLVKDCLHMKLK